MKKKKKQREAEGDEAKTVSWRMMHADIKETAYGLWPSSNKIKGDGWASEV